MAKRLRHYLKHQPNKPYRACPKAHQNRHTLSHANTSRHPSSAPSILRAIRPPCHPSSAPSVLRAIHPPRHQRMAVSPPCPSPDADRQNRPCACRRQDVPGTCTRQTMPLSGEQKKSLHGTHLSHEGSNTKKGRRPTLPHFSCSTIGVPGLNFSVRDGKRWNPGAIAA